MRARRCGLGRGAAAWSRANEGVGARASSASDSGRVTGSDERVRDKKKLSWGM
jgi:hypothetical protein